MESKEKGIIMKYLLIFLSLVCLISCSISFQNIDTHGPATDLIDENQTANPNVEPNIDLPLKPISM